MAVRGGMYNANKRKKELARKKKQEEKRLKRQKNTDAPSADHEASDSRAGEPESPGNSPEIIE